MSGKDTKVLLITTGYSSSGAGEVFLNSMLSGHTKKNIHRYSFLTSSISGSKDIYDYNSYFHEAPYSNLPGLSTLKYNNFKKNHLDICLDEIQQIVKTNDIEVVWIILNSTMTFQVGSKLSEAIDLPIITHIWDAPEYLVKKTRLDPITKRKALKAFDKAMTASSVMVSVSDSMNRIYKKKYSRKGVTIMPVQELDNWHTPKQAQAITDEVSIIFAGSLYAFKEWNAFLEAVEIRNNSNIKPKIKVTCIGNVSRWTKKKDWVTYESLKPVKVAGALVNKADIAYLPYWTQKEYAYFVKTAFPNKLSFYLAAGTPLLFHGPEESTPAEFLRNHKIGLTCSSLDSEAIIATIIDLCEFKFRKGFEIEQIKTLNDVFHPDRCIELFEMALDQAIVG